MRITKDLLILSKEGNKVRHESPFPTLQENSWDEIELDGREENLDVIVCFINEKGMITCPHIEKLSSEVTSATQEVMPTDANLLNEQIWSTGQ
jgi:hypothetical protein